MPADNWLRVGLGPGACLLVTQKAVSERLVGGIRPGQDVRGGVPVADSRCGGAREHLIRLVGPLQLRGFTAVHVQGKFARCLAVGLVHGGTPLGASVGRGFGELSAPRSLPLPRPSPRAAGGRCVEVAGFRRARRASCRIRCVLVGGRGMGGRVHRSRHYAPPRGSRRDNRDNSTPCRRAAPENRHHQYPEAE